MIIKIKSNFSIPNLKIDSACTYQIFLNYFLTNCSSGYFPCYFSYTWLLFTNIDNPSLPVVQGPTPSPPEKRSHQ